MNRRARSTGPELYDFRRPTKLSREHVRALQMAYEQFARQFTTVLTSSLRSVSQVTLVSIEQLTYDEYIASLDSQTLMAKVELEPLPGPTILEFGLSTAMACIDHMLGGPGGQQPERPLTDIEAPLVRGLIERVLGELRASMEPIVAVRPRLLGIEYSPQFAQFFPGGDVMIVGSFEMRVGAEECVATICMPFGGIFAKLQGEPGGPALTDAERASREQAQRTVVAGLQGAPVDVSVRFRPHPMRPADLMDLQPGDVVPLNHPLTTPLAVMSNGITFAHAVPGSAGRRLACLVVTPPQEDS